MGRRGEVCAPLLLEFPSPRIPYDDSLCKQHRTTFPLCLPGSRASNSSAISKSLRAGERNAFKITSPGATDGVSAFAGSAGGTPMISSCAANSNPDRSSQMRALKSYARTHVGQTVRGGCPGARLRRPVSGNISRGLEVTLPSKAGRSDGEITFKLWRRPRN